MSRRSQRPTSVPGCAGRPASPGVSASLATPCVSGPAQGAFPERGNRARAGGLWTRRPAAWDCRADEASDEPSVGSHIGGGRALAAVPLRCRCGRPVSGTVRYGSLAWPARESGVVPRPAAAPPLVANIPQQTASTVVCGKNDRRLFAQIISSDRI